MRIHKYAWSSWFISDDADITDTDDRTDEEEDFSSPPGIWMPIMGEDSAPDEFAFTSDAGPKNMPPSTAAPHEYIDLFLTNDLIDLITEQTNLYATQYIDSHQDHLAAHPHSMVHQWIRQGPTTREEIRAFFGVVINMGLIKKPDMKAYWNMSTTQMLTPWFPKHFSRDRFFLLLKFLHFADNAQIPPEGDPDRKLYKVAPLVSHFNTVFMHHYMPGRDISIDESIVGFRGRTPQLRQYVPKRHARFGIKEFHIADSQNAYIFFTEIYQGASTRQEAHGPTHALVMRLMRQSGLLGLGHHLTIDNYFTSPILLQELFSNQTTATGTVRANRRGLPRAAISAPLRNQEVVERRKGPLLCVAYQDGRRKPVLLTTEVAAGKEEVVSRRGEAAQKPKVVVKYNKTMGGVDVGDQMLYAYTAERRSMKWTTKVAFSLLARCLVNAFILYEMHSSADKKLIRQQFNVAAVEYLTRDYRPRKVIRRRRSRAEIAAAQAAPTAPVAPARQASPWDILEGHVLVKLPRGKLRDCTAGAHESRKRSSWECQGCDLGMCPSCFTQYHIRPRV